MITAYIMSVLRCAVIGYISLMKHKSTLFYITNKEGAYITKRRDKLLDHVFLFIILLEST